MYLRSDATYGEIADLYSRSKDVQKYVQLMERLEKEDKKADRLDLVKLRESGLISTNDLMNYGFASVYFKEVDKVIKGKDGETKFTNAQIRAIAQLCPELIKSVMTPEVVDEAIRLASGKRSEAAKTIQSMNIDRLIKTSYQAYIGEAKNYKTRTVPDGYSAIKEAKN